MKYLLLLMPWLLIACAPPHVVVAPGVRAIAVRSCAAGAVIHIVAPQFTLDPMTADSKGDVTFERVPSDLPSGMNIFAVAPGFQPYGEVANALALKLTYFPSGNIQLLLGTCVPLTVPSFQYQLPGLVSLHFNPDSLTDQDKLNMIGGSLAGIYLDAIIPQCPEDPQTHIRCQDETGATPRGISQGVLFTANYRLYTAAQRKIIRDAHVARRLTSMTISIFSRSGRDYHGIYPPIDQFAQLSVNDALHELWDNDGRPPIMPVCFARSDDEDNDDVNSPFSLPADFDSRLCGITSVYWEHWNTDCSMQRFHDMFPNAIQAYHNPAGTDAGYGDACWPGKGVAYPGGFEWYAHARAAYNMQALLLQNGDGNVDETVGRIADFTASFSSNHLRATPGVAGMTIIWFEDQPTVFDAFWSGGSEATAFIRNDQVLQYTITPLCEDDSRRVVALSAYCSVINGYGSGWRLP